MHTYLFRINWIRTDNENLQLKVRILITKAYKQQSRSAIELTPPPQHLDERRLMNIPKELDKQIAILRSWFQDQPESSILHRAINIANKAKTLQLKKQEMLMYHKTNEEKMHNLMKELLYERHLNELTQYHVDNTTSS